jgi:hypothetical protein
MCKRLLAGFCALGLLAGSEQAEPKHAFNRKAFLVELGLLGGSRSADMLTTRLQLDKGGLETNWLYGPRPSNARLVGVSAAFFVLDSGVAFVAEHSSKRPIRWLGRALVAGEVASETRLAACNASLGNSAKGFRRC